MNTAALATLRYFARVGQFLIGKERPRWLRAAVGFGVHVALVVAAYFGMRITF